MKTSWNKGLTKETSEGVAKHAEGLREYYKTHAGVWTGKKHSEETKKKISEARNVLRIGSVIWHIS